MYATRLQLAELVKQFQATGQMSPDLVTILDKIITGVAGRHGLKADLEDKRQEYYLLVLRKKDNIKTEGNVFSYLTTCAVNCLRARQRQRPVTVDDFEFVAESCVARNM